MKKYLIALLALTSTAYAEEVILSWEAPSVNTDGSAYINPAGYKVYYGTEDGGPYPNVIDISNSATTQTVISDLASNTYYFVTTAINTVNGESAYSEQVSISFDTVPSPPTNLVVSSSNLTAYTLSITKDILLTYPVGSVEEGTECNYDMNVNGLYLVPYDSVTFAGGADATVVFAECGTG